MGNCKQWRYIPELLGGAKEWGKKAKFYDDALIEYLESHHKTPLITKLYI